jgi:hypothetical protein
LSFAKIFPPLCFGYAIDIVVLTYNLDCLTDGPIRRSLINIRDRQRSSALPGPTYGAICRPEFAAL